MESLLKVAPVSPVAPYLGGKRNLARRVCAIIDSVEHTTYIEPFVGMGGIFLRRSRRPRNEVINDLSGDVATLFRVLQEHYPYFVDMLKWRITSRSEFSRLLALPADRLTDLQRAARYLYLQRLAFGGKVDRRTFGVASDRPGRFDITTLETMLANVHERLSGVVVEQLPYADVIRRYDTEGALFYLDPPYWGCESDYGDGFAPDDFAQLAGQLADIDGKFLLSINDKPGVRDVFSAFQMREVETTYTVDRSNGQRAGELLISNFSLP